MTNVATTTTEPIAEALSGEAADLKAVDALGLDPAPTPLRLAKYRLKELELFQSRNGIVTSHVYDQHLCVLHSVAVGCSCVDCCQPGHPQLYLYASPCSFPK